jgi:hypothetical protein
MKSIAYSRLKEDYPEADVELEAGLSGRIPDVLLTFPEPRAPYGKGIAVEAQYRNKGKDIEGTTEHYFENSYSVVWLEEDDFSNHDVDLSGILCLWPNALPDRQGLEEYSDVIQWLWRDKNQPVEIEIPLPGDFWSSFDKSGEWVTIAKSSVGKRGNIQVSKSPTGTLFLELEKVGRYNSEYSYTRIHPSDVDKLREFADELEHTGFGEKRPTGEEYADWYEVSNIRLSPSGGGKSWIAASLPGRSSYPILQLGKQNGREKEVVTVEVQPFAPENIRNVADLVDGVFAIEKGEESFS